MTKPRSTEHGLLMSGPMALAAFRGIKTQTRRPFTPQPKWITVPPCEGIPAGGFWDWKGLELGTISRAQLGTLCPYGRIGDRVYVREAWTSAYARGCWGTLFRADGVFVQGKQRHEKGVHYNAEDLPSAVKWRPSLHLPKWASRTWGTIASVRAEQVQSITDVDAIAEGIEAHDRDGVTYYGRLDEGHADPRVEFRRLWDSIYTGELSWGANPWVWVIEWRKEEKR